MARIDDYSEALNLTGDEWVLVETTDGTKKVSLSSFMNGGGGGGGSSSETNESSKIKIITISPTSMSEGFAIKNPNAQNVEDIAYSLDEIRDFINNDYTVLFSLNGFLSSPAYIEDLPESRVLRVVGNGFGIQPFDNSFNYFKIEYIHNLNLINNMSEEELLMLRFSFIKYAEAPQTSP